MAESSDLDQYYEVVMKLVEDAGQVNLIQNYYELMNKKIYT